ncbi:hypothetical protein A2954_01435 [Candidatus Roizmanbacteria bacterium RIFCSPLOWO2_01_FULL_37_12]|uniref:Peptidase A2 domain-containing protein n=1 Tax=Candidatus Roizmanbacteria bacterium RIFCSPLOWO2_01_FULL_37_12 TaxID=1802056 RepID=A0A1F7IGK9_9BACT|nr:MAG: hypothetical protein A3D76_00490 [Candidatus Roizmanbacteria bacterium RIFCSPHIGHO2_02_FULL_37_9b]OGK42486.1 MAG: hypothetical protein A2954_01435 [Candidatus Roizmanbacteria bacterium RIFCSPLOWO2_01_FULL_37_12]
MTSYPYQKDSRGNLYPIILFQVEFKKTIAKTSALIDSGASISIFREDVAKQLGLVIDQGTQTLLGGVGGRIKGYVHNLELKIAGKNIIAPVVFSYEYSVSFNLLGRSGIFENFKITFDEKNLVVKLQ